LIRSPLVVTGRVYVSKDRERLSVTTLRLGVTCTGAMLDRSPVQGIYRIP